MKTLALIALLLIGATSQAASIEIGPPSNVRLQNEQWWFFPPGENYTPPDTLPALENNPRDINVPTSKGRLPVTINQKTPVSLDKLGKAAVNFGKRVGPIGVGLGIAGLLCDLEMICPAEDGSNDWQKVTYPPVDPTNPDNTVPFVGYSCCALNLAPTNYVAPTPEAVCAAASTMKPPPSHLGPYQYAPPTQASPNGDCAYNNGQRVQTITKITNRACPTDYWLDGTVCRRNGAGQPVRVPVTPGDWDTAGQNPGLKTPDIIPDLIRGEEPVPVETPEIEPKTVPGPGGSTTETIRNGQGGPIGTKTTDTTVTVSPSGPTTVTVTETTTTTETNITNNTTTITTTETTLPNTEDQSEKPKEDTELDIDDVPDTDISTYEIPDTFAYDSWGGGSCPGDPTITAKGHAYNLPVHTVCEAMTDMRPAVLLIAGLVSAFIISGAFRQ